MKKRVLTVCTTVMMCMLVACGTGEAEKEAVSEKTKTSATGEESEAGRGEKASKEAERVSDSYWVCRDESFGDRVPELFLYDDGTFYYREYQEPYRGMPYYNHFYAESYTWTRDGDDFEFTFAQKGKKEIYFGRMEGNTLVCTDFFDWGYGDVTYTREEMPEMPELERDFDKLAGEWNLLSMENYEEYCFAEDLWLQTNLQIRETGEGLVADYAFVWDDGTVDIKEEGVKVVGEKTPINNCCINDQWCAKLETNAEETMRITLLEDNILMLTRKTEQYETEWEKSYYYLRKDSPEDKNRDQYRYKNVVTVDNVEDFWQAIGDNTKIVLKEGDYNLSELGLDDQSWDCYMQYYRSNLTIEAEEGAKVSITTENPYTQVLSFTGCSDITLKGITFGHEVEPGSCSGCVISLENCYTVKMEDCRLYGCGTYGIEVNGGYGLTVSATDIYQCTYGIMSLYGTNNAVFDNCCFYDTTSPLEIFQFNSCWDIQIQNCNISNIDALTEGGRFISEYESTNVTFSNCMFRDNRYDEMVEGTVNFNNCTFDK